MKFVSISTAALAGAASLGVAGLASAQPQNGPDTWTGPYVGGNAGWRGSETQIDPAQTNVNQLSGVNNGLGTVAVPPTSFNADGMDSKASRATWGGQVGFNKQEGHVVLGVEGDMDAVYGRRGSTGYYALPATGLTTGSAVRDSAYTDPHWTASLRGRFGWAAGPLLLYGTGGIAWENVRQGAAYLYAPSVTAAVATANPGATFGPYGDGSARTATLTGWTLGGGAEVKVTHEVSIGAEYRHSDYGHTLLAAGSNGPASAYALQRVGYKDDAVLGKVNFHFWGF